MTFLDRLRGFFGGSRSETAAAPNDEMISCEQALALVQEFIDGELEDVTRAQAQRHYDVCKACYPHLKFEESFREALRRVAGNGQAPADLKGRVVNALNEVEG